MLSFLLVGFTIVAPLSDPIVATPTDILDQVFAKKGHAFISRTNREWTPVENPRKDDEVVLSNIARRWNLSYQPIKGTVHALALPMNVVFPDRSQMEKRYRTEFDPKVRERLISREGEMLRVKDLLTLGKIDPLRCHWIFHDREILARVDPKSLEAALPDLATSLGAKYDVKKKAIEFDPKLFRDLLRQSVEEIPDAGDADRWNLAILAVDAASDTGLKALYATPDPKLVDVPLVGGQVNPTLMRYIRASAERIYRSEAAEGFLANLDPEVPPKIHYSPVNGPAAYLTQKGNRATVF